MSTTKQRYEGATAYVHRAIAAVEGPPFTPNALEAAIETYAGAVKTEPVRDELSRIEARWPRATSDKERETIAHQAELLADHTKENLPGAPQDWTRTNLVKGEHEKATPATSYQDEFNKQATHAGNVTVDVAKRAEQAIEHGASTAGSILKWLAIGGGVLLGLGAVRAMSRRQTQRNRRGAGRTRRVLDTALEEAAERNAGSVAPTRRLPELEKWLAKLAKTNPGYTYGFELGRVYARVWRQYGAQQSRSAVAFVDLADGTIYRAESWKKAGRAISTLETMLLDGRRLEASRNAGVGDGQAIDKLRVWMVTSVPPPNADARHQREWVRGYERMADQAMAALTNRGIITSPSDVKAWREAALRRLRWDNTTAGQGALAFLEALRRFPNRPQQATPADKSKTPPKPIENAKTPPKRTDNSKAPPKPAIAPVSNRRTKWIRLPKTSLAVKQATKKTRNADPSVAKEIRRQLGPGTLAMLGATRFVADDNSLQFDVKGSRTVDRVRIILAGDDTYTLEFWKGRGARMRQVARLDGVYVDGLHDAIESQSGLYTRMVAR